MPAAMPAASAQAPQLVVEADNSTFDLAGKSEVVIGREDPVSNIYPDVDLTPHGGEDGGVSRVHAKLLVNNGQYLLEDQNSTNFTYLNRQRLQPKVPTPVKDGDEIRLGRVSLRFHG
jgi:pSer/pThr/pTyr-binding forkhead associated (FHA) protein